MPDEAPAKPERGLRFSTDVNVGTVIQGAVILCGLIVWAVTSANRGEQAGHDLATMQQSVSGQILDLRAAVTTGLQDVRQQISTLPDQRARLEAVERRLAEFDSRLGNGDARMGTLERQAIEARSDINGIMRAANQPLTAAGQRGAKP